jgi:hypothetical protein
VQFTHKNAVTHIECPDDTGAPPLVSYDIDTCGGNSGSPVFDGPSGAPTAHAVHAYGYTARADPVCGLFAEWHQENIAVNGAYDVGEFIYRDVNNDGVVSTGDVRLTAVGAFAVGTVVACPADADCVAGLVRFTTEEKHGPVGSIYRDVNNDGVVSTGDVRLTVVGEFAAGTPVNSPADADCGFPLRSFLGSVSFPCFAHPGFHGGTGDNCGPGFDSGVRDAYTHWIQGHPPTVANTIP